MTTYSGFGTRKEEEKYNHLMFNVMHLLQLRLSSFYRLESGFNGKTYPTKVKDSEDTRLRQLIEKHYRKMVSMERSKYIAPRFTEALKDIASFLGCMNEPTKHEDNLSQDESLDRDVQTSDSHFSGFSRFSTSHRPSGFAKAPPPEGISASKGIGNGGSTSATGQNAYSSP